MPQTNLFRRMSIALIAATICLAGPAVADRTSDAVAALKQLAANPSAPVAPVLGEFKFREATFLIDRLTHNERRALREAIDKRDVRLPGNVEGAIIGRVQSSTTGAGSR